MPSGFHEYESRLARPMMLKLPEFQRNERLKHVLFAQQFNRDLLDHLGTVALMVRNIAQTKEGNEFLSDLLPHKRAMFFFTQASTRTFLSFMAACQLLGMKSSEIRDPSVSSEYKGEHPLDSMRMFSSYFDIIIIRSSRPNFSECCAYLMNDLDLFNQRSVPIVNAGSGADEHPTQALLDMFTVQRVFSFQRSRDSSQWNWFEELQAKYPGLKKGVGSKVYGFCGDIGRGRTIRSLATLLSLYENIAMYFVSPQHPKLRLPPDLKEKLLAGGVEVHEADSLDPIIHLLDLLYMTRIQHEHDSEDDKSFFASVDLSRYCLTKPLVVRMKEYAPILHPFPRNEEIPFEIDRDQRAMYFRQARNGIWMRAALLAHLFDVDGRVTAHYRKHFSDFHDYNMRAL